MLIAGVRCVSFVANCSLCIVVCCRLLYVASLVLLNATCCSVFVVCCVIVFRLHVVVYCVVVFCLSVVGSVSYDDVR